MNTKLNSELGEFEKDAKVGVLGEEKRGAQNIYGHHNSNAIQHTN